MLDIKKLLVCIADIMQENKELLIQLDSVVGDGDLGLTMSDGFAAASQKAQEIQEADIGKILYMAGKAMSTAVPSTMGTLMASGLMQAGKVLKGKAEIENVDIVTLFEAFEEGVANRGKAQVGDKTFIDGIHPAVESLKRSVNANDDLVSMANKALQAANEGYENTATMLAVHGRAATRGEASRSLKDPGAYVAKLIMEALTKAV